MNMTKRFILILFLLAPLVGIVLSVLKYSSYVILGVLSFILLVAGTAGAIVVLREKHDNNRR